MDDTTTDNDDVFLANTYTHEPSHHLMGECSQRLTIAAFPFRDTLAGIIPSLLMPGRSDPGEFGPSSVLAEFFKALLTTSMS